jgi:hypothetical protein
MQTLTMPGGWYYRHHGEKIGPVSAARLKELLASGELQPRQAVWQEASQSSVFVPAEAAASGGLGTPACPPTLEPVS